MPHLPPPPAPLEVAPLNLMDAVSRLSAALWNRAWQPQPRDQGYAGELLRAAGCQHRDRQAVNRANGVLVPSADSDEPRLLQQALDVESAGTGLHQEIGRYNRAINNVAVRQENPALPSTLDRGGPLSFLMDAILAISAAVGPLAPHRAWRAYGGPTPTRRQADAFEHDHLHPYHDAITTAATYLTGVQTLLDQITKAPPGPWLDMTEREQLLARLGLPHRGWRQDQREVWAEGFAIPGAPPRRQRHYNYSTALGTGPSQGDGPDASADADGVQIAARLTADLAAGAWAPTEWEQDRAGQLRTFIADSRSAPTPAVELLSDGTPNDWLVRADALWRVSQECEELADWWTGSGQQALPLLEAVRAIRRAIPRRVNLAVVDAQLGQQTGLWKPNVDKDFPPALRATVESAERTLAAMSTMLARLGAEAPPDSPT